MKPRGRALRNTVREIRFGCGKRLQGQLTGKQHNQGHSGEM